MAYFHLISSLHHCSDRVSTRLSYTRRSATAGARTRSDAEVRNTPFDNAAPVYTAKRSFHAVQGFPARLGTTAGRALAANSKAASASRHQFQSRTSKKPVGLERD